MFDHNFTTITKPPKEDTPSDNEDEESDNDTGDIVLKDDTNQPDEKEAQADEREEEGDKYAYTSKAEYIKLIQKIQTVYADDSIVANMATEELRKMLMDVMGQQLQKTNDNISGSQAETASILEGIAGSQKLQGTHIADINNSMDLIQRDIETMKNSIDELEIS